MKKQLPSKKKLLCQCGDPCADNLPRCVDCWRELRGQGLSIELDDNPHKRHAENVYRQQVKKN